MLIIGMLGDSKSELNSHLFWKFRQSLTRFPSFNSMCVDQHYGCSHCSLPHEDIPRTKGYGQDACQVSPNLNSNQTKFFNLFLLVFSPDGDVIVTNDGATILEKMEVSLLQRTFKLLLRVFKSFMMISITIKSITMKSSN